MAPKRLKKREFFVHAGDPALQVGFVAHGLLESYRSDAAGKDAVKRFCPEGSIAAPYMDLILGRASTTHLRALEPTVLLVFNYADWVAAMEKHMCLQKIGRLIAEHEFVEREERELTLLMKDARERLNDFAERHPGLLERVPANRLAAYLGINPVTLSRLRST
ncbi:MAG: Crp/Fnr family transcriptional regulator [Deltaproteobacteria bacterium]|nr:Crp/Fnr family transcriptional regulator [Deltaproteobacteria bacterium]